MRLEAGQRVRIQTSGSVGVIYKCLPRAAATIKTAEVEAQKDRTPYSVQLERDGSFVFAPGWDLEPIQ